MAVNFYTSEGSATSKNITMAIASMSLGPFRGGVTKNEVVRYVTTYIAGQVGLRACQFWLLELFSRLKLMHSP